MNDRPAQRARFWGEFTIAHGSSCRWRIGPLVLSVSRREHEWRVCRASGDPLDESSELEIAADVGEPPAGSNVTRYATASKSEALTLTPVLPDRSVVTRPERAITVLAEQEVTVYVGSPLWIRLEAGELLDDLPALPPKRTWWGPNTRDGELCYATRTYGRLRLQDAVRYPHRVLTAVVIKNGTDAPLTFERLNLPVRRLSVHVARDGGLWTELVTLERAQGETFAELQIGDAPPSAARGATKISDPRDPSSGNFLFRAFGSFFDRP